MVVGSNFVVGNDPFMDILKPPSSKDALALIMESPHGLFYRQDFFTPPREDVSDLLHSDPFYLRDLYDAPIGQIVYTTQAKFECDVILSLVVSFIVLVCFVYFIEFSLANCPIAVSVFVYLRYFCTPHSSYYEVILYKSEAFISNPIEVLLLLCSYCIYF
ncbi:unnamed protein product [Lepeophtheirus salmonis]|uniref:(salmon louse) hypothetical protein n=1 Tax=Lepeophtheirus salmonis TaxID=72036 RepID=A0A7R8H453_LEPSM|nr:unnamed protein product [Lepeophtheirus salmonis]CAF2844516.1 unnamed protein product [Lepeophtheirus salmonis]